MMVAQFVRQHLHFSPIKKKTSSF